MYCHNMNTSNPQEYITLSSTEISRFLLVEFNLIICRLSLFTKGENYSAYYERRSRDKDQCMYNEHDQWEDSSIPSGQTTFSKVRVDLHSLQVVIDDYTFSRTSGRRRQPFATAGDCFSSTQQCPRGVFSINFEKTKFRIRPRTKWETRGMNATQRFASSGVSDNAMPQLSYPI